MNQIITVPVITSVVSELLSLLNKYDSRIPTGIISAIYYFISIILMCLKPTYWQNVKTQKEVAKAERIAMVVRQALEIELSKRQPMSETEKTELQARLNTLESVVSVNAAA